MTLKNSLRSTVALVATAGVLLAGCTGGGPGGSKKSGLSYKGLSDSVAKSLSSYAIVNEGGPARDPDLGPAVPAKQANTAVPVDAHFMGVKGATSLNAAMEKGIASALKDGGANDGHKAFSPVTTKPGQRWPATRFLHNGGGSAKTTTASPTEGGEQGVRLDGTVLAAGGNVIITQIKGTAKGQPVQFTYASDVNADETKPAADLFKEDGTFDDAKQNKLGVSKNALPTVGGKEVSKGKLSEFGQKVRTQLAAGQFKAPRDKTPWLPSFSCGLLPCVGVTYDDGPGDKQLTDELAKAMKKNNVRGTFFMIGQNVKNYPDQVKQLYKMGNEIENHTWNHPQLPAQSPAALKSQLQRTNKAITDLGIPKPTQMRPPYGAYNKAVINASGQRVILWDIDTEDWKTKDKQKTIQAASKNSYPGSMFLMHSIHKWTVDGADETFKSLKARGMYPVPTGYMFKGLPFKKDKAYYCRSYRGELCSNPEHPAIHRRS